MGPVVLASELVSVLERTSLPPATATRPSPSSFCRLWAQRFVGVDTYINIYIKTYGYIFLSFLHLELHGLHGWHVLTLHTGLHAKLGSLGTKKNAFLFPARDIC